MKIVVLDGYTENPGDLSWDSLGALGDLTVYDRTPKEQVIERIGDAEAVYVNKVPIDRKVMDKCPSIRFIGVLATGYNVIDVEAAREKGLWCAMFPPTELCLWRSMLLRCFWNCAIMPGSIPHV